METKIVNVTPAMARMFLKSNTANRPLRFGVVEGFRSLYERGEWKLTHQGIAFDSNGTLIDGQHRLTFISHLPEGTKVPMMVTRGLDTDTFGAIDVGAKRTAADEMHISKSLTSCASFLVKLYNNNQSHMVSHPYLRVFVDFAQPYHDELISFCNASVKIWSSAVVKSAAILQLARGRDEDFVKSVYRSLVTQDMQNMTPTAMALVKQQLSGKLTSARSLDLFCRAFRAFDSRLPHISKVQIVSSTETTRAIREFLFTQIDAPKLKKKDPRIGGSKGAKSGMDYT